GVHARQGRDARARRAHRKRADAVRRLSGGYEVSARGACARARTGAPARARSGTAADERTDRAPRDARFHDLAAGTLTRHAADTSADFEPIQPPAKAHDEGAAAAANVRVQLPAVVIVTVDDVVVRRFPDFRPGIGDRF